MRKSNKTGVSSRTAVDETRDDGFLFRALLDTTSDSVYVKDRECRLVRVSRQMAHNLGFDDPDELVGKSDADLFGAEFAQRTYLEDLRIMETDQVVSGLVESRRLPNGGLNWTLTTKMPFHDRTGKVIGLLGVTREINELKQAETSFQYLATHDNLTALPNRYLLMDRLDQVLARSQREGVPFAVLFVDIDDFKGINDGLGHAAGDELLRTTARRLRKIVRASDTVARIGGDEFVLLIDGAGEQGAVLVALKILRVISASARVGRGRLRPTASVGIGRLRPTASVGIALYPRHGSDPTGLITAADHAMYLAKKNGKNGYLVFPTGSEPATATSEAKPA